MKDPWNEDWEYDGEDVRVIRGQIVARGPMSDEDGRLAAAAPAMARLLSKIRQTYVPDGDAAAEICCALDQAGAMALLPDWCRPDDPTLHKGDGKEGA